MDRRSVLALLGLAPVAALVPLTAEAAFAAGEQPIDLAPGAHTAVARVIGLDGPIPFGPGESGLYYREEFIRAFDSRYSALHEPTTSEVIVQAGDVVFLHHS